MTSGATHADDWARVTRGAEMLRAALQRHADELRGGSMKLPADGAANGRQIASDALAASGRLLALLTPARK